MVACILQASKKKASKRLEEKIAEKEMKSKRKDEGVGMTPEEKLAEKLRRQKLVEDADFELAKETFGRIHHLKNDSESDGHYIFLCSSGITSPSSGGVIDGADPSTKEQFAELKNNICQKLQSLSAKDHFNEFMEELVRDLCVGRKCLGIHDTYPALYSFIFIFSCNYSGG